MSSSGDIEEHDYTLLQQDFARQKMLSMANLAMKAGAGVLLAGAGIGMAAYGISFALKPEIIETEKVVVTEKVVTVEVPKIVEKEVLKVVEVPTQQPQPLPAAKATPAPKVGDHLTDAEFENNPEFQSAEFRGRITGIRSGRIYFSTGNSLAIMNRQGNPTNTPTTDALNGNLAYCAQRGAFLNGKDRWRCHMNRNNTVVNLIDAIHGAAPAHPADNAGDDIFGDLFQ